MFSDRSESDRESNGKYKTSESTDHIQWNEKTDGTAIWSYDGKDEIYTLADALSYSNVDSNVWEVERHIINFYPTTAKNNDGELVSKTNTQVKVWFAKRADFDISWSDVLEKVRTSISTVKIKKRKGNGIGVVGAADFHFGAYVDDLIRSDVFNTDVLTNYLKKTVDIINSRNYSEVHLCLLGDFIESFTGLNHRNSWKGLARGQYGMNAIVLCFEILYSVVISQIHNLKTVYIVSGNHDRVTSDSKEDAKGEVGMLLAYLLEQKLTNVEVKYHPMVLTEVIDGICYVMTHGHLSISKKEISKMLFDYGKQGYYNVVMQGHLHSRMVKKTHRRKQYEWKEVQVVQLDEADYRFIVLPPMFTGNFYSESIGFSSSAGVSILENNGSGKINYFDYCL